MLRILQYFYFSQKFGPQVVMIFTLLKDLPFFFFVFAVFMFAYGIFSQALLRPNSSLSWMTLYEISFTPFFAIYGQFDNMTTQMADLCWNVTETPSDEVSCADIVVTTFVLSGYLLFAVTLLMNLLIAMMNSRYDREVDGTTTAKWLLNRNSILGEYVQKSWLVPPLIFLSHVAVFILFVWMKCHTRAVDSQCRRDFKKTQLEGLNKKLDFTEKSAVDDYFSAQNQTMIEVVKTLLKAKNQSSGRTQNANLINDGVPQEEQNSVIDRVNSFQTSRIKKNRGINDSEEGMQIEIFPDTTMQLSSDDRQVLEDIRKEMESRLFRKQEEGTQKLLNAIADLKKEIRKLDRRQRSSHFSVEREEPVLWTENLIEIISLFTIVFNTIFVSSHIHPENSEGTQIIFHEHGIWFIPDTARNRTHNLFRPKCAPIRLDSEL